MFDMGFVYIIGFLFFDILIWILWIWLLIFFIVLVMILIGYLICVVVRFLRSIMFLIYRFGIIDCYLVFDWSVCKYFFF